MSDWRELLRITPGAGRLDPGKLSLGTLLAGINVLLVIIVIGGISLVAVDLLGDLADDQGMARVQVAGATVREDIREIADDTLLATRALAERPTLQRLWREQRVRSLEAYLKRICQAGEITGCALTAPGSSPIFAGKALPWDDILNASTEQGERLLVAPTTTGDPLVGAVASIPAGSSEAPAAKLILMRALDAETAARLAKRAGMAVRLLNYNTFADEGADNFTPLHTLALGNGRLTAERLDATGMYASSYPLFASTGEAIGLIETRLPVAIVESSVEALIRELLLVALLLGILAGVAGIVLGRWVANPVRDLTAAATRLGQGDFSTSIPVAGAAEVGTLASTMEDMRRSLVDLTNTLRSREAEAQAVLDGIVEGVYAVDRERRIRYLNPRAAELLGVSATEAVGRFCGDVLKPAAGDGQRPCETNCPILQARALGSARATERLAPRAGASRTTVITSSAMVDDLQVQVIRDETELEGVRRARDSVLANISHEFRTPLAAQLASIELLRDGLDSLEPQARRDLVLSLERGTVRLTRLIDNLLESVRIESGQLSLRRQSVVLPDVIDQARELSEALVVQRRQMLLVELPESLPAIYGDSPRLTQVFVNLLANASKFAPEGSTIRIGGRQQGEQVEAWVEDEGTGVPDLADTAIFDRFYRGRDEEPEPTGLGLGLWIVKSIVERHGGQVSAGRTTEGRTRFSILLPVARPE
ncbi:MAG: HAMP domain-containing protein [Gammaproteobacteria bacterium]|nr:HAMP domain-containing protein [Gammaproteobacteria bacterium]